MRFQWFFLLTGLVLIAGIANFYFFFYLGCHPRPINDIFCSSYHALDPIMTLMDLINHILPKNSRNDYCIAFQYCIVLQRQFIPDTIVLLYFWWNLLFACWPGILVTWLWLRLTMIYCCALRLWSQICVTWRRCWFPGSIALSCCVGARCLGLVRWLHTFEMVTGHFANTNFSVVTKCCFLGCVMWDRTFMCTVFIATLT